ncbi:MAG: hypothetical protein OEY14_01120, partial [Myxococcales bacterium]|nr:hypothetical protein [Myxococcales bacterium]
MLAPRRFPLALLFALGCSAADAPAPSTPRTALARGASAADASTRLASAEARAPDLRPSPQPGAPPEPARGEPPYLEAPRPSGHATLATGPGGHLSLFRLLETHPTPLDEDAEAALAAFVERAPRPAETIVEASERIDLREHIPARHAHAYLGLTLHAATQSRLHLLLGIRGAVQVRLDGRPLLSLESSHLRRDHELLRLELEPGEHRLLLRLDRPSSGPWLLSMRVLDAHLRPGAGAIAPCLGPLEPEAQRALSTLATALIETRELDPSAALGPRVRVRALLPGGGPARTVAIELAGSRRLEPRHGVFEEFVESIERLPERGGLGLRVRIEGEERPLGRGLALDRRTLAAAQALRAALPSAPPASRAPIAWREQELERIVREGDRDRRWRDRLVTEARSLARALARGRDPFGAPRGYQRMATYSALDGEPQPYELFVPPAYRARREWPLLLTLHGFEG